MKAAITLVALSFSATALHAFSPTPAVLQQQHSIRSASSSVLQLRATAESSSSDVTKDTSSTCRRSFLVGASGTVAAVALSLQQPALAADDTKKQPICVIGCNGRTGTEVVKYLIAKNEPIKATSRTGEYNDAASVPAGAMLEQLVCDVTDPKSVNLACAGTSAVIFAASASKSGGTPSAVDNAGLVNVAKACMDANVPHLVVVSSGAVTKPSSPVYQFLNLFGNIMEEKVKGEDAVRKLYAEHNANLGEGGQKLTYTIIRPGGLTLDPPRGVAAIELNQGDTKSGRLARADVAQLCVESLNYPHLTGETTFECYDADTGAPLATVGLSNIAKKKTDGEVFVSGFERRGNTYEELFTGLQKDA
ncbi:Rossmann-fold NAD(P)-binding domain-containing protein [Skeletonema marinoi]|uniref:Rossmann-fold NAD(P)-binding domain-containing protein n=1 Tax=Skeletonema marinoi TaxID=267567 RepID=A0AAD8YKJ7_9STRA|nr:Rossmann-fold NAD(P)-binding domain-containing protein [Skeletonema marinoi]